MEVGEVEVGDDESRDAIIGTLFASGRVIKQAARKCQCPEVEAFRQESPPVACGIGAGAHGALPLTRPV